LLKAKTDCYRNGKNVVISKLDSLQCPFNILRCYLEEANVEMNTDMYIFRTLTYFKKVNKFVLRKKNVKLSYTCTREILEETLSSIGLKAVDFGLHSLRSGGATAAYSCGVSDRLFKIHGHWKSEQAKDG
jgi:hypothetical protein